MVDEKSVTEKLTDAVTKITDTVKSTVSTIVDKASDAAQHSMEADAKRMVGQPVAFTSITGDAAAMPMPLIPVAPNPTKKRAPRKAAAAKSPASLSGRITPTYDYPAPKSKLPTVGNTKKKVAKKASKNSVAKKAAKRAPAKKSKSSIIKKSVGKNKNMSIKKTGKKAKKAKR